ncbi:MAG: metallophosphoesterase family protein [Desulfotomaculum sp.]|nr:metallophosphoesterase family protein [Desulfotomaculum sp.]
MDKTVKKSITVIILAIFMSLTFLHLFGGADISIEGLEFHVNTSLALQGTTQIEIPPLGLIRAHTHNTPIKITVRLYNINLERVQNVLENKPNQEEIFRKVEENLRIEAQRYIAELIFLAASGGIFAAFILRSNKPADYFKAIAVSVAVVGLLLGATYKDFHASRFNNPEYEGVLKAAPWMICIAEKTLAKIDTLSHKLQLAAQNFNELYNQIENLSPIEETEGIIKVLHVSDIHNNPAAIQLIGRMAELFEVDFIIDTGDISDFGTPLEGLLLDRIENLNVPYVYIAGNHDSPDIINKMKELSNVIVAEHFVELNGLTIMGFHDPASQTQDIEPPPPHVVRQYLDYIEDAIRSKVNDSRNKIDIIAVHSPYIAKPLAEKAPIFVFGHNHQYKVSKIKNSILVNAGTSGASGLGTLQEKQRRPYSVMLLHFSRRQENSRLLAVDSIQVDSITGEFSMQRHLFSQLKDNKQAAEEIIAPGQLWESENDE